VIDKYSVGQLAYFMPFEEAVTYYQRTGPDQFTAYIVYRARRKVQSKSDPSFSDSLAAVSELSWQITAQQLPVGPQTDDYLTDGAGVKWIVTQVRELLNANVWDLACRKGV
jgi:hypothetical protein